MQGVPRAHNDHLAKLAPFPIPQQHCLAREVSLAGKCHRPAAPLPTISFLSECKNRRTRADGSVAAKQTPAPLRCPTVLPSLIVLLESSSNKQNMITIGIHVFVWHEGQLCEVRKLNAEPGGKTRALVPIQPAEGGCRGPPGGTCLTRQCPGEALPLSVRSSLSQRNKIQLTASHQYRTVQCNTRNQESGWEHSSAMRP